MQYVYPVHAVQTKNIKEGNQYFPPQKKEGNQYL